MEKRDRTREFAVSIEYWTREENDFLGLEEFSTEINKSADLSIQRSISYDLGGGLFEFIVNVASDLSLHDLIKSYLEDGIKFALGLLARDFIQASKRLFASNSDHRPDVAEVRIKLRDFQIVVYSTYERSVEDALEETLEKLFSHLTKMRLIESLPIKSIHIPIFWHNENVEATTLGGYNSFEIPAYRTRLTIDETMRSFSKEQYFDLWGIRTRDVDVVYSVKTATPIFSKFYLEEEYWKLQSHAFDTARLLKTS